jgi:hypothetical protein
MPRLLQLFITSRWLKRRSTGSIHSGTKFDPLCHVPAAPESIMQLRSVLLGEAHAGKPSGPSSIRVACGVILALAAMRHFSSWETNWCFVALQQSQASRHNPLPTDQASKLDALLRLYLPPATTPTHKQPPEASTATPRPPASPFLHVAIHPSLHSICTSMQYRMEACQQDPCSPLLRYP